MNVLVGCEFSGTVSDAFWRRGHRVWTCDLEPTEHPDIPHFRMDIVDVLKSADRLFPGSLDLIILHPPCTHMAVCGNRWWAGTEEREAAVKWTLSLWDWARAWSDKVCMENPASVIFPHLRKAGADVQYVQPNWFGHMEQKKTGLALHGLRRLEKTNDVYEEMMKLPVKEREKIWYMSPSKNRAKERSRFYKGMAEAMAEQWGMK